MVGNKWGIKQSVPLYPDNLPTREVGDPSCPKIPEMKDTSGLSIHQLTMTVNLGRWKTVLANIDPGISTKSDLWDKRYITLYCDTSQDYRQQYQHLVRRTFDANFKFLFYIIFFIFSVIISYIWEIKCTFCESNRSSFSLKLVLKQDILSSVNHYVCQFFTLYYSRQFDSAVCEDRLPH